MRSFWNRPLGSKVILLLGIAFLIEMLAPWQRVCAITSGGDDPRVCGWRTAYGGSDWGIYIAVLAGVIVAWELLPILIPKLSMRGWPAALVTAALATLLVICTIGKLVVDNEFQTGWAWIGLGIAIAIAITSYIRVRYRWGLRHVRPKPAPTPVTPPPQAEPPPAGGSGP